MVLQDHASGTIDSKSVCSFIAAAIDVVSAGAATQAVLLDLTARSSERTVVVVLRNALETTRSSAASVAETMRSSVEFFVFDAHDHLGALQVERTPSRIGGDESCAVGFAGAMVVTGDPATATTAAAVREAVRVVVAKQGAQRGAGESPPAALFECRALQWSTAHAVAGDRPVPAVSEIVECPQCSAFNIREDRKGGTCITEGCPYRIESILQTTMTTPQKPHSSAASAMPSSPAQPRNVSGEAAQGVDSVVRVRTDDYFSEPVRGHTAPDDVTIYQCEDASLNFDPSAKWMVPILRLKRKGRSASGAAHREAHCIGVIACTIAACPWRARPMRDHTRLAEQLQGLCPTCLQPVRHEGTGCNVILKWDIASRRLTARGVHTHAAAPGPTLMPPSMDAWVAAESERSQLQPAQFVVRYASVLQPSWRSNFAIEQAVLRYKRGTSSDALHRSSTAGSGAGGELKALMRTLGQCEKIVRGTFATQPVGLDLLYLQTEVQRQLVASIGNPALQLGFERSIAIDDTYSLGRDAYVKFGITGFSELINVGATYFMQALMRKSTAAAYAAVVMRFVKENPEMVVVDDHAQRTATVSSDAAPGTRVVAPSSCFFKTKKENDDYFTEGGIDPSQSPRLWWIGTVVASQRKPQADIVEVMWDFDRQAYGVPHGDVRLATARDNRDGENLYYAPAGLFIHQRRSFNITTETGSITMDEVLVTSNDVGAAAPARCALCNTVTITVPSPHIILVNLASPKLLPRICAQCSQGPSSEPPVATLTIRSIVVDFSAAQLKGAVQGFADGIEHVVLHTHKRFLEVAEKEAITAYVRRLFVTCTFHWRQAVTRRLGAYCGCTFTSSLSHSQPCLLRCAAPLLLSPLFSHHSLSTAAIQMSSDDRCTVKELLFSIDRCSTSGGKGTANHIVYDAATFDDVWTRVLRIAPMLRTWKKWAMRVAVHTFPAVSSQLGGGTPFDMAFAPGSSLSEMMHAREDRQSGGAKKDVQSVLVDAALISTQQAHRINEALSGGGSGSKRSGFSRSHLKRLFNALTSVPGGGGAGGGGAAAAGPLDKTSAREEKALARIDHFVESSSITSIALNTALNTYQRGRVLMYARAKGLQHTVHSDGSGVQLVMLLK